MSISVALVRELESIDPSLRHILLLILEEIEKQQKERVTKDEFKELKGILAELADAQKRTEEQLSQLAEAQKRTEERLNRLENIVAELAEAQKRTEERLDRLEKIVAELAEAQKRTEERLNRLENIVAELAEAQKRTEERLDKLIGEHKKTREQVGGLSHTVGYILENQAYVGLPPLLRRDFGIEVKEPIKRDYVMVGKAEVEVNIIGRGKKDGRDIWILGESKTQLKKRDIDTFLKKMERVAQAFPGDRLYLVVTHQASPKIRTYAREKGVSIYYSYQFGQSLN